MHSSNNIFSLKLTDVSGNSAEEILSNYINALEHFLDTKNLDDNSKLLYETYLRGLKYYQFSSNSNSKFFCDALNLVNEQSDALKKAYPNLQVEGRIKSVLSADEKIKDKICEYIKDNRDLNNLNYSLRDFIAFRFIIPPSSKKSIEAIEVQRCYRLLKKHIQFANKQGMEAVPLSKARINKINKKHAFNQDPKEAGLYIPKMRSVFFKRGFSSFVKDYIRHPKQSLYQSLHYCASLPNKKDYPFPPVVEFQFRTKHMHEHSEYGVFSHNQTYKKEDFFHFLNVPTYIKENSKGNLQAQSFDKNLKIKYGEFEKIYHIPYSTFIKELTEKEQIAVLNGTHLPHLNENTYHWELKELQYLPSLDFQKYKINFSKINRNFNRILRDERSR